ncbi:HNH nuclease [uncultured Caudovirales phage]|uniref:HNH nuclease n=1 Tax=uncultured Caudovirales phage TaxID=2100421 RepID=A0A6J5RCY1_9CAUD|nr:HNH nuclease [uncultured Caudovirales phage]
MIEDRVERFWSYVDKRGPDECWNWTRYVDKHDYGQFGWPGTSHMRLTHRIAWQLTTGVDAAELCVCHRCDNPKCCNPLHLFIGTHADNMSDKTAKGREARGEQSNHSDLVEQNVRDIRSRYVYRSSRFGLNALSREYGVSKQTIWDIVKRCTWTHL